jgi:hypothetical protein
VRIIPWASVTLVVRGGWESGMDSQFEFDWDMLMSHSYVWDLFLIRLSFRERKETPLIKDIKKETL